MKVTDEKTRDARSAFTPLKRLQALRKVGAAEARTLQQLGGQTDFIVRDGEKIVTFRYGVDFVDGNERLRWTPAGIEKLISAGMWRRELDKRGNLESKPITPAGAMKLPGAQPLD